jgi:hypothetical protein
LHPATSIQCLRRRRSGRSWGELAAAFRETGGLIKDGPVLETSDLRSILKVLHAQKGFDFSIYKSNTLTGVLSDAPYWPKTLHCRYCVWLRTQPEEVEPLLSGRVD